MTREERNNAIKVLKNFDLNNPKINSLLFSADEITNAFNMAIKALEQEPILDKIRAEIDKIYEREGNSVDCLNALDELKEFIDKYKAEAEDT